MTAALSKPASAIHASIDATSSLLNGLPRFNHPVFGAKGFERVGDDRFMLLIEKSDPKFDETATRQLLEGTHPKSTQLVESN